MPPLESDYKIFGSCSFPAAKISIDNEEAWDSKGKMTINSIDISMGVSNESSSCIIKLSKPFNNFKKGLFVTGNEFDVAQQGADIKVFLGYSNVFKKFCYTAFSGFISRVQIKYVRAGIDIIIECMDSKMWMMAGKKYEKKLGNKYSNIVRSVLDPAYKKFIMGSSINIIGEPVLDSPIYQSNESDYEFLCELADITGSFFYMYLDKAYFISPSALKNTFFSISPSDIVKGINWESDVLGISQSIEVKGVNAENPKLEVTSAPVVSNIQNIGQGLPPQILSSNIGSVTKEEITDDTASNMNEARFKAQSRFTKDSINFIKCIVEIKGYTSATTANFYLGMGVKISGFSQPIDNTYILTKIEHRYDKRKREFKTILTLSSDSYLII